MIARAVLGGLPREAFDDDRRLASHADVDGGALAFEVFVLEGELGVEGVEVPGAVVGADGVLEGAAAVEEGGVLDVELAGDFGDFADVHDAAVAGEDEDDGAVLPHAGEGAVADLGAVKKFVGLEVDVGEGGVIFHHGGIDLAAFLDEAGDVVEEGFGADPGAAVFDEEAAAPVAKGLIDLAAFVIDPAHGAAFGVAEVGGDGEPEIAVFHALAGGGEGKLGLVGGHEIEAVGREGDDLDFGAEEALGDGGEGAAGAADFEGGPAHAGFSVALDEGGVEIGGGEGDGGFPFAAFGEDLQR